MARGEPQITTQTLKVLGALLSPKPEAISGAEVGRTTKLATGTVYPILLRLEEAGWVESHWEEGEPQELGRPRRRLYQITGVGAKKAKSAFHDVSLNFERLAWR